MTEVSDRLAAALADRYRIERELGAGGMATVYLAQDLRHRRQVAIKVLKPELAAVLGSERFLREIEIAAKLTHSHILPLHDSGEAGGLLYYVMPHLAGQSLRDRLNRERHLPIEDALAIATRVADALDYAHRHGVIHRDIKPENILLHEGQPMLSDFGIALAVAAAAGDRLTETGISLGTPQYMAPEQATGERQLDGRTDIYSLAAVLYELLAGEPPHRAPTVQATIVKVLTEEPDRLSAHRGTVPPHVEAAIHKALQKLPADRFHTAAEFAAALTHPPAPGPQQPAAPSTVRRRSLVAAFGLALGALAAGAILGRMFWRAEPPSTSPVRVHRLTEFTGVERFPALSPDGRSVAFAAEVDGKRQLWVRLVAGGPALQITRDPADHLYPRWSRDSGSLIYFTPPAEGEEVGSLWEISALGGAARRLASSLSGADMSSADDRMAFFRLGTGRIELLVAKRDGTEPRVMAELESGYTYGTPRWSPDGRALAFERRYVAGESRVFVIRTGDSRPTQLAGGLGELNGFAWLPHNSGLVFSSSRGSIMEYLRTFQLWTLRLDERRARQLTFGEASYLDP
ncbi:MAG: serine/threonine-protein kinase, partial [Gemmatimonadetes bacterium]|nr:serine/threonine-protein kinase [Gemmatimonadota bacterium]